MSKYTLREKENATKKGEKPLVERFIEGYFNDNQYTYTSESTVKNGLGKTESLPDFPDKDTAQKVST
jgi:hypothetical protein